MYVEIFYGIICDHFITQSIYEFDKGVLSDSPIRITSSLRQVDRSLSIEITPGRRSHFWKNSCWS